MRQIPSDKAEAVELSVRDAKLGVRDKIKYHPKLQIITLKEARLSKQRGAHGIISIIDAKLLQH